MLALNAWGKSGKASVLVGGQFGSEGKGLAAAWMALACGNTVDVATTNAGAQAGHTTKFRNGEGFVCFHLPTTAVIQSRDHNGRCAAYINGGSILDPESLEAEVKACGLDPSDIMIHPRAAVITASNKATEREPGTATVRIASTQKGVGAAIADKVMRRAVLAGDNGLLNGFTVQRLDLNALLSAGRSVVVEVPQGMDLSLNHGLEYPSTTSRDCWVGSGLSDAGIHPSLAGPVCMVVRTFPIRVGNYINEQGEVLGTSGPFYDDSRELDWATNFPDVEPERTTVTRRIRRIATWSDRQYRRGLLLNRPDFVFLTFCNYLRSSEALQAHALRMREIESEVGMHPMHIYSFSPYVEDVTCSIIDGYGYYRGKQLDTWQSTWRRQVTR